MEIMVVYESGSVERMSTAPFGMGYGVSVTSDFLDLSRMDEGIFLTRMVVPEPGDGEDGIGQVMTSYQQDVLLLPPDALDAVKAVMVDDRLALRRNPGCGEPHDLENMLLLIGEPSEEE